MDLSNGPATPPTDWSDVEGWNAWHSKSRESSLDGRDLGLHFVASFREKAFRRIWFPGSGVSVSPRAFAELGFDVLSTDFSPVAAAAQAALAAAPVTAEIDALLRDQRDSTRPTMLSARQHDFRHPLDADPFDVVLNRRAFQGLSLPDMRAAATIHYRALRQGGWAIFDTMNVQGTRRDDIESTLADAGFAVPLYETHRWYRAALRDTGVDFVMILGRPLVPGANRSQTDQAKLDAVTAQFHERAQREAVATKATFEAASTKIAHVVYSTG
jgi:hypothetical protein